MQHYHPRQNDDQLSDVEYIAHMARVRRNVADMRAKMKAKDDAKAAARAAKRTGWDDE